MVLTKEMDDDQEIVIRKNDINAIIVFIGNIPNGLADDHMIKLLHAAGNLRQWKRIRDNMGSMRSFGFVHFMDPISVLRCDRILNNYSIVSPLGIKGNLAVRIDEKTKKQLDRWIQDNPKDGNPQFDAPFIAKVSAIANELQDEKPMSYQLMNIEKQKTEQSVRQIHEQRRKAGLNTNVQFHEKENLGAKFEHRLKQWLSREKEHEKRNNKLQDITTFTRVDKDKLAKELANWNEDCNHLYYTHRVRYLKERRPYRLQEERKDGWDIRQADSEAFDQLKRKRVGPQEPLQQVKKVKFENDVPNEIKLLDPINWNHIESRVIETFRPMILLQIRKAGIEDENGAVNRVLHVLRNHCTASELFDAFKGLSTTARIKCVDDIFRILKTKSNK